MKVTTETRRSRRLPMNEAKKAMVSEHAPSHAGFQAEVFILRALRASVVRNFAV